MIEPQNLEIPCHGYSVAADWYESRDRDRDRILLCFIGWSSKRARYQKMLSAIVGATGMSALVFDYSGHGDSPFELPDTRPAQHFLEVISVFDWVVERYPDADISVMGTSYGGFLATQLTKYRRFTALVLRVPAIYQPSDFYSLWRDIDMQWTEKVFRADAGALARHPLLARAAAFTGNTLVVMHEKDDRIAPETTDAYIVAFDADTYIAKGFKHSFGKAVTNQQADTYNQVISDWLTVNSSN